MSLIVSRRHPQEESTSPDEDADDCSADDEDPKDPSEDSGGGSSESDCSSLDERGDLLPLSRPHLGDHGNRPRPNAQQPPAAEESGQKDRGEEQEKPGWRVGGREKR